ncbi:MAG: alpha/beta fold hydrolase [Actinobacteria bacterium]|nr:alpha/beta fold hydrolase [Actinomycetota bacterium]
MTGHERYAAAAHYTLDNPGGAQLVVLLHGLGADHRQPLDLIAGHRLDGAAVLAPDARAHGGTPIVGGPADFRFDALVADLAALIAQLGQAGKPTHLVGVSMGAAIALRAALRRDVDVRSLTLVRPAFTAQSLPPNLAVMAHIGAALGEPDLTAARARFADSAGYRAVAAVSALGAASLMAQFDAPDAVARAERLRSVPTNTAYSDPGELAAIAAATLVVGTERDPVHPMDVARAWGDAIGGSHLAVIPPRDDDPVASATRAHEVVCDHLSRCWTP